MKKICIVTITYNSEEETHACIVSLKKLVIKNAEISIVIVDNASDTIFTLSQEEKKNASLHILRSDSNLGFTGGNNLGISFALSHGANYVLLINNDTLVDKYMLQFLLEAIEDDIVGIAVPKIYFAKGHEFHKERYKKDELGKVLWFAGGDIDWNNGISFHRGVDEVDHGQYDDAQSIGFATGCCMLFKKEVFEKIGMFDNAYFLYYEDADICERVKRNGFTIMYQPKASMWHITAASSGGSGSKLHDYFLSRNKMIFGMRYGSIRLKIALFRESMRLLFFGRKWQKTGIIDYYAKKLGKGSWE